ncbi:MAG: hypothetical protein AAF849_15240 [Bacteroidota bacterium]
MDKLKELVSFLDKSRLRRIDVIGNQPAKKGRSEAFYQALTENQFDSDKDAAEHFFGKGANESDRRYKELKERLYSKLLNTVFFIDETRLNFNKYQKTYYELVRDVTAANILMRRLYYKNATYLLKKSLRKANNFDLLDLQYQILQLLKRYHSNVTFNRKKYTHYEQQLINTKDKLEAEYLAEKYFTLARMAYVEDRTNFKKHYEITSKYYHDLEPYLDKYDILNLHIYARVIKVMMHTSNRELEELIKTSDDSIRYLEGKKYANPNQINYFLKEKAIACLQLGKYEEGIRAVEKTIKKNSYNATWLNSLYLLSLLHFHLANYEEVYKNTLAVKKSKSLPMVSEESREPWILVEAYLQFLIEAGILNKPKRKSLKVSKFINEVPTFSKGKRSTNVPILVLQILFSILRKEQNTFVERLAAIQRYNNRYLLKDNTYRSNCFIKMLVCVGEASFNRIATERRAKKFKKRLAESPLLEVKQNYETEYLPYEKLWEIVLNLLDDSRYYR